MNSSRAHQRTSILTLAAIFLITGLEAAEEAANKTAIDTASDPAAPAASTTGKITSFPLPAQSGNTYGDHYFGFPFVSNGISKHVCMSYCPDNNRIYAQGGDTIHSATDGTWSVDATKMDDWRLDVGQPKFPDLPAPHALQDGFGFEWSAKRKKFLLWPGAYYAYDNGNKPPDETVFPLLNYSCGCWWFDPATKTYTQDRSLFGKYLVGQTGTGCLFGGVYDDADEQFLAFGDASNSCVCMRWDAKTMKALPQLPYTLKNPPGTVAYFERTKYALIGRHVYIIGIRTDGNPPSQVPVFLCWSLDAHSMTELPPPPVDGKKMQEIEIRPGVSHGKVVWPFANGPDGEIRGIYVYDPAAKKWAVDRQVPKQGAFIGNSVVSLPDGRVGFSGGVFGRQQTHFWFYEAEK